jgi:5'-3' exonuclease
LDHALSNLELNIASPAAPKPSAVQAQSELFKLLGISPSPVIKSNLLNSNEQEENTEESDSPANPLDDVRLGEEGWKTRYYESKFGFGEEDVLDKARVVYAYIEGLCWVLKYYFHVNTFIIICHLVCSQS